MTVKLANSPKIPITNRLGILAAIAPGVSRTDLISGHKYDAEINASYGSTSAWGPAGTVPSSGGKFACPQHSYLNQAKKDFTLYAACDWNTAPGTKVLLHLVKQDASSRIEWYTFGAQLYIEFWDSGDAQRSASINHGITTAGKHALCMVRRANDTSIECFADGVRASGGFLNGNPLGTFGVGASNPIRWAGYSTGTNYPIDGEIYLGVFANKAWSSDDAIRATKDPDWVLWSVSPRVSVAPYGVSLWTPTTPDLYQLAHLPRDIGGAPSGDMAGSGLVEVDALGSMQATGDMAGSASIAVSASGSMVGIGALQAAPQVSVSASGSMAGVGALQAAPQVSVDASGAMIGIGDGAMTAAAEITVSASGSMVGVGAMASASQVTVDASGALTAVGDGSMAGAAEIAVSASGVMAGVGSMAGAAGIEILSSGSMGAIVTMAGSAQIVVSTSGAAVGVGSMAGAAGIEVGALGSITGVGSMTASPIVEIDATSTAIGSGSMVASVEIDVNATGTIKGVGQSISGIGLDVDVYTLPHSQEDEYRPTGVQGEVYTLENAGEDVYTSGAR